MYKASISFFVAIVVLSFFLINNIILTNKMKRVRLTMIELRGVKWVMNGQHGPSRARPSCARPENVTSRAMMCPGWKMLSLARAIGMS